ncbi:hypothetical protein CEXT_243041 [Caerostris extrusa]|uniref:Uncharacterized protein n=1 Tax=Caerostris extrusa TaxID=172846 RepID=A0AAV4WJ98_CAEEX|nr:hypothetical protein CEXT_243041 [Caerostris extrusa]
MNLFHGCFLDHKGFHIILIEATSIIALQVECRITCEEINPLSFCGPIDLLVNPDQKLPPMRPDFMQLAKSNTGFRIGLYIEIGVIKIYIPFKRYCDRSFSRGLTLYYEVLKNLRVTLKLSCTFNYLNELAQLADVM